MTSELRVDNLKGSTTGGSINVLGEGTSVTTNLQQGLAKSWVNFNGTSTVAVRDSLNVSSISDTSTGAYFQNFTNNMNAVDFCGTGNAGKEGGSHDEDNSGYQNLSEISGLHTDKRTVFICKVNGSFVDRDHITGLVHGDLA